MKNFVDDGYEFFLKQRYTTVWRFCIREIKCIRSGFISTTGIGEHILNGHFLNKALGNIWFCGGSMLVNKYYQSFIFLHIINWVIVVLILKWKYFFITKLFWDFFNNLPINWGKTSVKDFYFLLTVIVWK
jgi:hypothetical protein